MMDILGIDIGGSGIKGAPVDSETGKLKVERYRIPTPQPSSPEAVAEAVGQLARNFAWQGPIGCGMPSVVKGGQVFTAANIDRAWIGTNVVRLLEQATGCPVRALNDADAAGL